MITVSSTEFIINIIPGLRYLYLTQVIIKINNAGSDVNFVNILVKQTVSQFAVKF